eukprot:TRINITY_DN1690_c0_g1::TRINITY_DN1690_c0_g1_i2::g.17694::m.17694 TRINITY_DN1690_c0_g1::TRINITY_DN1690_c0_g1_i2::g.17694  ORF type:complete len:489 (-),score=64.63,sp/Q5RC80/RBM39_PONAB/41.46/6e-73,RRM_1/PF00076.17/8.5e-19,RRM_1/PF00076.17/5.3e-18,RRM_1/PF00076.17/0.00011,RRM_5/PF13893.1/2.1e-08,RRM_5/PF13893.1/5.6e-11,RRM_5/PF13893.1/2.7e-08,RRM_6/PF14259.1/2.9e-12,RRM_6/PF14259.1/8.8e-14,RRM_6/PF14259.1/2.7,RBM39linker/PF15519.1/9.7e-13,Nup35_RRM_2/PF14605.1/7.9,Nup35_RRM_2/PF14605.1/0.36,Nup35_
MEDDYPVEKQNGSRRRSRSRSPRKKSPSRRRRSRSRSPKRSSPNRRKSSPGRRKRSRSPRERRRSHSRSPRRSRRSRSRSRSPPRSRGPEKPDPVEEARRNAEREAEAFERDMRTVFVNQLVRKATEKDIEEFFEKCGKVKDVRLITDRYTRKSKGFGYVEFESAESVPAALQLNGTLLYGFPVAVKRSESEKNQLAAQQEVLKAQARAAAGPTKLFVGNVHPSLTKDDLTLLFEPFGELENIDLATDGKKQHQGTCYVQYKTAEAAKKAMTTLNGLDMAGQQLKVGLINDRLGGDTAGGVGDLDDEDRGLGLNQAGRATLMAKLSHGTLSLPSLPHATYPLPTISPTVGLPQSVTTGLNPPLPRAPLATQYIVLTNMFDPKNETDPDFDQEIKEDVADECTKFGKVEQIYCDKRSMGCVYLKMGSVADAQKAIAGINGRFFAGKTIAAFSVDANAFNVKYQQCK